MINYTTIQRANLQNKSAAKLTYAVAQYTEVMDLDKFAKHIASHGCTYSRADIAAVLTLAVDCIREQLLEGKKIKLGDLGDFYVSLNTTGVENAESFNPAVHVKKVNVNWTPGDSFEDLKSEAVFNLVTTRTAAAAVKKAVKAGESTVTIKKATVVTPGTSDTPSTGDDSQTGGGSQGGGNTGSTDTGSGSGGSSSEGGNTPSGGDSEEDLG